MDVLSQTFMIVWELKQYIPSSILNFEYYKKAYELVARIIQLTLWLWTRKFFFLSNIIGEGFEQSLKTLNVSFSDNNCQIIIFSRMIHFKEW